ncbi:MAG: hypothetical protein RMJ16_13080 [Thermoguttaceae bacterium]|nr:hypothetical protein [Thermoguttaceae bacterium]
MRATTVLVLLTGLLGTSSLPAMAENVVEEAEVTHFPWSGYWWPFHAGGLTGPLLRYDRLTGKQAARWEEQEGRANPQAPPWHGYCHATAAAAVMEPEPRVAGALRSSTGREEVQVSVGYQKGWLAACHTADVAEIYGERFSDGEGPEDPQDIAPDQLWHLLRLYVRERGVPLVLDIEPGPEVWNYPVFAYRIVYDQTRRSGEFRGQLTLWMADSSVPPDFVGLQVRKHTYTFNFRMEDGAVVMGSGRWTGISGQDHPDFAWYPYMAVAENPEVDYRLVTQLLTQIGSWREEDPQQPSEDGHPTPPAPPPPSPPSRPDESRSGGSGQPSSSSEQPRHRPPDRSSATETLTDRELVLSPQELLALVTSRTSSFKFDVTVDRFDGAAYQPGETYSVVGATAEKGFLYIFLIDPSYELRLLYPHVGQNNAVEGMFEVPKPSDLLAFRVPNQPGVYRLKAVITRKPIRMVGLLAESQQSGSAPGSAGRTGGHTRLSTKGGSFHWHPASKKVMREVLMEYTRGDKPPAALERVFIESLGGFAQDEVAFYVPAPREVSGQVK